MSSVSISSTGVAIVKAFESCLKPVAGKKGIFTSYLCPANVLTIGWGHTNDHGRRFKAGDQWSQAECDMALAEDLETFENSVAMILGDDAKKLNQNQQDALVSFSYNIGPLTRSSIPAKVKAGRISEVPEVMARWNKGGGKVLAGLTRRRKAEGQLFAGDVSGALATAQVNPVLLTPPAASDPMPQKVDTPKPPAAVVAQATKREQTAIGTGTVAATASGVGAPQEHPYSGAIQVAGIALGIAVLAAGVFLFVRKYQKVAEDWR